MLRLCEEADFGGGGDELYNPWTHRRLVNPKQSMPKNGEHLLLSPNAENLKNLVSKIVDDDEGASAAINQYSKDSLRTDRGENYQHNSELPFSSCNKNCITSSNRFNNNGQHHFESMYDKVDHRQMNGAQNHQRNNDINQFSQNETCILDKFASWSIQDSNGAINGHKKLVAVAAGGNGNSDLIIGHNRYMDGNLRQSYNRLQIADNSRRVINGKDGLITHPHQNLPHKQSFYNVGAAPFYPSGAIFQQRHRTKPYEIQQPQSTFIPSQPSRGIYQHQMVKNQIPAQPQYQLREAVAEQNHQVTQLRSIRARANIATTIGSQHKLDYSIDRCYEHFKLLEKERKKIEVDLNCMFPDQKISSANNIPIARPPPNPTRLDRLVIDMSREHAKLITLVAKMEQLRGNREFSGRIDQLIQQWLDSIRDLQMKRRDEIIAPRSVVGQNPDDINEAIVSAMSVAVQNLCDATRSVRTALWCSYITTVHEAAQPVPKSETP